MKGCVCKLIGHDDHLLCEEAGHEDRTVPGTRGLSRGAEMKQCSRCGRVGWLVFP